jgi:hypothetical protein
MITLIRRRDWRSRLDAYLDSIEGKPFAWGQLDCALFAADTVLAMTGVDLAESFRGRYSDQEGAAAAIKAAGADDYEAYVATVLPPPSDDNPIGIGDIAAVDMPGFGPCLALVGGAHLTAMTLRGKGSLPFSRATRFFKVG